MHTIIVLSNIFAIIYWVTRINPVLKFLATYLLSLYCINNRKYLLCLQFIFYAIGDITIETHTLNTSIIFFTLGKLLFIDIQYTIIILWTYYYFFNYDYCILMCYKLTHICYLIHNYELYKSKNSVYVLYGNILFIISDVIIAFDELLNYKIFTNKVTYLLYWISNLIRAMSTI